jgi:hypothetical protein
MKQIRIAALTVVGLFMATLGWAQSGAITGVVTDASGGVLPGVTVEASSPALIEQTRTGTTDGAGVYRIIELRPGTYTVTFTLAGFQVIKRENITLTTGFTASVNASLPLGSVNESVTVVSESPIVDTVNNRVQSVVSSALIEALPLAKNAGAYSSLIPGATGAQDVGGNVSEQNQGFSIHGGSSGDFQQYRDGMMTNTLIAAGNLLSSENPSMLQEVVVETGGFDATAQTGGGHVNMIPKDGGNQFSAISKVDFATSNLQSSNLDAALNARGATTTPTIRQRYDVNGAFGGPIAQNRLWFIIGARDWDTSDYQPNNYYNATQGTMLYTPDASRPAYNLSYYRTGEGRVTWQASPRNKVTASYDRENNCACFFSLGGGLYSPEASGSHRIGPDERFQSTWSSPLTSHLLLWAGVSWQYLDLVRHAEGGGTAADRAITDQGKNYHYGGYGSNLSPITNTIGYQEATQANENFTLSYIAGQHSLQAGFTLMQGIQTVTGDIADGLTYTFKNNAPFSVTEWASPFLRQNRTDYRALFLGDQWRLKNLTLNLGVRWDGEVGSLPAQTLPAGPFVPARSFAAQSGSPDFNDIDPRLGGSYDLFGNGKTAIKVSLSRNIQFDAPSGLTQATNPVSEMVLSTTRTWTDPGFSAADAANPNFLPACDLHNPAQNSKSGQTCGVINNSAFGQLVANTTYSDDVIKGWYKRPYNWTSSIGVSQQVLPNLAVNVGYFRTWYGNFTVTDNTLVTPADYSTYSITTPVDSALPGGGGQVISGLYDISPTKASAVQNLVVPASTFGKRTQVYNGIDTTATYRHGRYVLAGGMSTGSTTTDQCFVVDSPQQLYQCHNKTAWYGATQFKFQGVAPLPKDFQLSANFQMLPSIPLTATYNATSASIKGSLGRDLAAGSTASAAIPLINPNTLFVEGWNRQLDISISRTFKVARVSILPRFDVYNALNANPVLSEITTYTPTAWQNATSILAPRVAKFGVQIKF